MTDAFLHGLASNLIVSGAVALLAYTIHRSGRFPAIAHALWLLVLLRLVIPPVLVLPIVPLPASTADTAAEPAISLPSAIDASATEIDASPFVSAAAPDASSRSAGWAPVHADPAAGPTAAPAVAPAAASGPPLRAVVLVLWVAGTLALVAVSTVRLVRFQRALARAARPAGDGVHHLADDLACRFGLARTPEILVCRARVAPLVWWVGGRVRVVLPEAFATEPLDARGRARLRWILAHEFAHVRRRDHAVRWLEWAVCTLFWWNPVAWWARRNLRLDEETCCDALVLRTLEPRPREYAGALLDTVAFLAASRSPALHAPALASGLNAGDAIERRIRMIVRLDPSDRSPRRLRATLALAAALVMPLGVAYAQDLDAVGKRLRDAVAAGELTAAQAREMMDALRGGTERARPADDAGRAADLERRRAIEARVEAAVEAGRLQRDDADRMTDELLKRVRSVEAAVASGRLSRDEAARMVDLMERNHQLAYEAISRRREIEDHAARIEAAVAAGTLSRIDADRMIGEARERTGIRADGARDARRELEGRLARIRAAAERGDLSRDEAERMIREAERRLHGRHEHRDDADAAFARDLRRLEAAVARGELSRADAGRVVESAETRLEVELRRIFGAVRERRLDVEEAGGMIGRLAVETMGDEAGRVLRNERMQAAILRVLTGVREVEVSDERAMSILRETYGRILTDVRDDRSPREGADAELRRVLEAVAGGRITIEDAMLQLDRLRGQAVAEELAEEVQRVREAVPPVR